MCCSSCRELYESGLRAFVSFVHFYHKHECKLIFQPKSKLLQTTEDEGRRRGGLMLNTSVPKLRRPTWSDC